ncbi:hypothetical protein AB0K34_14070 [Actinomadura sp. NPDC049382]|uniref:hypothetical protein n=1 Tax=Actinomadura sp. NPDC049382 TaxID=3158220 RepID=UPI00343ACA64
MNAIDLNDAPAVDTAPTAAPYIAPPPAQPAARRPLRKTIDVLAARASDTNRLARLAPLTAATTTVTIGTYFAAQPTTAAGTAAAAVGGLAALNWRHIRSRLAATYSAAITVYASAWAAVIAAHGLSWSGPGDAAFVAGAAALAAPYAYRNRWRCRPDITVLDPLPEPEPVSDLRRTWDLYQPAPAELTNERKIPNGHQAHLVAERGTRSVEDILNAARLIRSAYDPHTAILEPISARTALLTVLERDVLNDGPRWAGPTLDPATGILEIGRYPDGTPAHGQFWAERSGATDFFVVGTKGSGKSAFLDKLVCELHRTPLAVAWISDPQEGQCLPDWIDAVDRYAIGGQDNIDQNMRLLRALERIVFRRSRYFGQEIEWVDHKGRERKGGKKYFDPNEPDVHGVRIPLLYAVLDEMHALVKHPVHGAEALYRLGNISRLDRKTGIGKAYAGHSPSQNEMGGHDAAIIRNLIKEGTITAFRTGEPLAAHMLGLSEDPSKLPARFSDGSKTHGLGLIGGGPDGRSTQFRAEYVEDVYGIASQPRAGVLDAMSAEAAAEPDDPDLAPSTFTPPGYHGAAGAQVETVSIIPSAAQTQTWAHKILPLLADGEPRMFGAIFKMCPDGTSSRSVRHGLRTLVSQGLVATDGDKKPYVITDAGRAELQRHAA